MPCLSLNHSRGTCPVHIDSLDSLGPELSSLLDGRKVFIVSDRDAWGHWGTYLASCLGDIQTTNCIVGVQAGVKTAVTALGICEAMGKARIGNGDVVIGFGGGTVTDLCGFAAGIYSENLSLVLIPTTLVAACDAAVGNRRTLNAQGQDHGLSVSLIPQAVFIDTRFLTSLPDREFLAGLAWACKAALLGGGGFLDSFACCGLMDLDSTIQACCMFKIGLVQQDEPALSWQRMLEYAIPFEKAALAASGYCMPSWQAISIALVLCARVSDAFFPSAGMLALTQGLLGAHGLLLTPDPDFAGRCVKELYEGNSEKRVNEAGELELVLLGGAGHPFLARLGEGLMKSALGLAASGKARV